jgi:glycosyltransferase involved in cell wall biosynthesis
MKQGTKGHDTINSIAFIGNHLPRKCGIATFTTDLCDAFAAECKNVKSIVLAMNDTDEEYDYPSRVKLGIDQHDLASYIQAANFINVSGAEMVSLQHEYGIYGGGGGSHILTLLKKLSVPVVTTLHTVLQYPDAVQYRIMKEIAQFSNRVIVMSKRGADFLQSVYDIPESKIDIILHGVPDMPFVDPGIFKIPFGFEKKKVLFTSGFLSPNKGIEHVINALPAIIEKHPDTVYLVLGTTHPHVKRQQGESYRDSLIDLSQKLRVGDSVIFHNKFVDARELGAFTNAADIFITPYNGREQIVSGVLSYAMGAGKAIISTPYVYAQELLSHDRGVLVPFRDPSAISQEVLNLFNNRHIWETLRNTAYHYGRQMIWPRTVQQYMESFKQARNNILTFKHENFDEGGEG